MSDSACNNFQQISELKAAMKKASDQHVHQTFYNKNKVEEIN